MTITPIETRYAGHLASRRGLVRMARTELAGRDLMCWCPQDAPCHGDVLLDIANPHAESVQAQGNTPREGIDANPHAESVQTSRASGILMLTPNEPKER